MRCKIPGKTILRGASDALMRCSVTENIGLFHFARPPYEVHHSSSESSPVLAVERSGEVVFNFTVERDAVRRVRFNSLCVVRHQLTRGSCEPAKSPLLLPPTDVLPEDGGRQRQVGCNPGRRGRNICTKLGQFLGDREAQLPPARMDGAVGRRPFQNL